MSARSRTGHSAVACRSCRVHPNGLPWNTAKAPRSKRPRGLAATTTRAARLPGTTRRRSDVAVRSLLRVTPADGPVAVGLAVRGGSLRRHPQPDPGCPGPDGPARAPLGPASWSRRAVRANPPCTPVPSVSLCRAGEPAVHTGPEPVPRRRAGEPAVRPGPEPVPVRPGGFPHRSSRVPTDLDRRAGDPLDCPDRTDDRGGLRRRLRRFHRPRPAGFPAGRRRWWRPWTDV
jgi:hypothetical protein